MSSNAVHTQNDNHTDHHLAHRLSTETKASTKTTELVAYVAAVSATEVTALIIGDDGQGGHDPVRRQARAALHHLLDHRLQGGQGPGQVRQPRAPRRWLT